MAEGTPDELKAELQGDAIHVELPVEAAATATTVLARIHELREPSLDGRIAARPRGHGALGSAHRAPRSRPQGSVSLP